MSSEAALIKHIHSITGKDINSDTELMGDVMNSFEFISFLQNVEIITGKKFQFDQVDFSRVPTLRIILKGILDD